MTVRNPPNRSRQNDSGDPRLKRIRLTFAIEKNNVNLNKNLAFSGKIMYTIGRAMEYRRSGHFIAAFAN